MLQPPAHRDLVDNPARRTGGAGAFLISRHYQRCRANEEQNNRRRLSLSGFSRAPPATRFPVIRRHGSQIFASKKLNWKYLRQISGSVICQTETEIEEQRRAGAAAGARRGVNSLR
ncbi:hypothetical protein MTP99_000219 [Tenebrio molitor]|nr:hypothetical protein MTP99_000219 [Tenebrio molitor]